MGVTAGLEIRVQPHPAGPTLPNTPERRRGAAMAALARGSQGIYLFNYFDVGRDMPQLLKELHSVKTIEDKDRSYVVTYCDISVPGQPIAAALPRKLGSGESAEFSVFVGPKPLSSARGEVQLVVSGAKPGEKPTMGVTLNGGRAASGPAFGFGPEAFAAGYNKVGVKNTGTSAITIEQVEIAVTFPPK